jgi:hypothetical protein
MIDNRFSEWNLRLLERFFSRASEGQEVFLQIDNDILDAIGADLGGDQGFIESVRRGAPWGRPRDSFESRVAALALQRTLKEPRPDGYEDPSDRSETYVEARPAPTYLPYLAALVRSSAAATGAGFYAHLRRALELPADWETNEMRQIVPVWEDLAKWSTRTKGAFGLFRCRQLGKHTLVGIPRSQCIVSRADVDRLTQVFAEFELTPDSELSENVIGQILEACRIQQNFSRGFCEAMEDPVFNEAIVSRIRNIYEEWDGLVPIRASSSERTQPHDSGGADRLLKMALALQATGAPPWHLEWRVPALQDSGRFKLVGAAPSEWAGRFSGTLGGSTDSTSTQTHDSWKVAHQSATGEASFRIEYNEVGDSESQPRRVDVILPRHLLWILTPTYNAAHSRYELQESHLPASGAAYLLAPPSRVASLLAYLQCNQPDFQDIVNSGLPSGWKLVCLRDCSALSDSQRALPDGHSSHPRPRAIRFVGGRSVSNFGVRQYLSYDLPLVELDCEGATLRHEGLLLSEEPRPREVNAALMPMSPVRRFKIAPHRMGAGTYLLEAVVNGEVISQRRLRIAGTSGEYVNAAREFSLDSSGNPQPTSCGLLGVLQESETSPPVSNQSANGEVYSGETTLKPSSTAPNLDAVDARRLFLDSLAQTSGNGWAYGRARDHLEYLLSEKTEAGDPISILMELRSLGHVELETTTRGHLARIHAVPPTVYGIPVSLDGMTVHAVLGSLRLQHWAALSSEKSAWILRKDEGSSWLLLAVDDSDVEAAAAKLGFRYRSRPAIEIARWSASLEVVKEQILRYSIESVGKAGTKARRFSATETGRSRAAAVFEDDCPLRSPIDKLQCELWQADDLDTGRHSMHLLSSIKGGGVQYSYVRDARWGKWIALNARAKHVRDALGFEDACPWPIPYDRENATFWLPSRLGLPVTLERALVLSRGRPPDIFDARVDASQGKCVLRTKVDGKPLVFVSRVYAGMNGRWSAYRWVPVALATAVAGKLGSRIDTMARASA